MRAHRQGGRPQRIAADQTGQPLIVAMRLFDNNCNPILGGIADIWACNATGHYSAYGNSPNERPSMARAILFGHIKPDVETRFFRGALKTDDDGIAEVDTIVSVHAQKIAFYAIVHRASVAHA